MKLNLQTNIQNKYNPNYWIFFSVLVVMTLIMMYVNGSAASNWGYDFPFHYRRLDILINALREGSYPIYFDYWNVEGYGYFFKAFYPDFTILPFALIGMCTSTYFAYDLMIFTITILCGAIAYYTVNKIYKSNFAATVTAILYTFSTYRLYDIYQRGALGEAMSFTFIPLIFLGMYYIIKGDYRKWYVLAIGYSLLIYTHLLTSVLTAIALVPFVVYYYKSFLKEPKRIWYLLLAAGVTLLIVSFYVIPMLEQMLSNSFYYNTHSPGGKAATNKYSFTLVAWGLISGLAYPKNLFFCGVGILLSATIFLRFFVRKKTNAIRSVDIGLIISIVCIFASSQAFPWGRFPFNLLGFIQFPWRLYEYSTLFLSLAGGYYLSLILKNRKQKIIAVCIISIATIGVLINHSENFKYLFSKNIIGYENSSGLEPSIGNYYHLIGQEYLPSKLPSADFVHERGLKVIPKNTDTKISNLKRSGKYTLFDIQTNGNNILELPLLYYKGYSVTLDGKELPIEQSEHGLIQVSVDESGRIEAYYKGTTLQWISFAITIVSILGLCVYIILWRRRKEKE